MKFRHVFGRLLVLAFIPLVLLSSSGFFGSTHSFLLFLAPSSHSQLLDPWIFVLSLSSRHFTLRRILHLELSFRLFTFVRLVQFPLCLDFPVG